MTAENKNLVTLKVKGEKRVVEAATRLMFPVWQRPRVEVPQQQSWPTHHCHLIRAFAVDLEKTSGF